MNAINIFVLLFMLIFEHTYTQW